MSTKENLNQVIDVSLLSQEQISELVNEIKAISKNPLFNVATIVHKILTAENREEVILEEIMYYVHYPSKFPGMIILGFVGNLVVPGAGGIAGAAVGNFLGNSSSRRMAKAYVERLKDEGRVKEALEGLLENIFDGRLLNALRRIQ
ncbi:MAG: hypothetical protein AB4372_40215 [Xenococcus sp. (in: cyanobacteria)]